MARRLTERVCISTTTHAQRVYFQTDFRSVSPFNVQRTLSHGIEISGCHSLKKTALAKHDIISLTMKKAMKKISQIHFQFTLSGGTEISS